MADPRVTNLNRVGAEPQQALTFKIDGVTIVYDATKSGGATGVGLAVAISGPGTVALTADADEVAGVLNQVEPDGVCSVQRLGVVRLPSNGTTTNGTKIVGALSAGAARGYVRSVAAATLAEVAKARHQVIDASDATSVEIQLGN